MLFETEHSVRWDMCLKWVCKYANSRCTSTHATSKKMFDNYTLSITRENYESESSLVESLLADLNTAALQAHITALPGVSEAIVAVRTAQTAFATNAGSIFGGVSQKQGLAEC